MMIFYFNSSDKFAIIFILVCLLLVVDNNFKKLRYLSYNYVQDVHFLNMQLIIYKYIVYIYVYILHILYIYIVLSEL